MGDHPFSSVHRILAYITGGSWINSDGDIAFFSVIRYDLLCSIDKELAYNVRGSGINSDGGQCIFFGDKTCSTVLHW